MTYFKAIIIASLTFTFSSCSLQKGHVEYKKKKDEIIVSETFKDFIKNNPRPSIILKAPLIKNKSIESDPNSSIYIAIEKELLKAGFDVKDRGLFSEILNKSTDINYTELKKLTNTELLLELVNISKNVKFETNKFFTKEGVEKIGSQNIIKYGSIVEFKLTIIETNQFAGSYTFYYTPCTENNNECECVVPYKEYVEPKTYPNHIDCKNKDQSLISEKEMIDFVKNGVQLMITKMKN